jgi:hypothetical protein
LALLSNLKDLDKGLPAAFSDEKIPVDNRESFRLENAY